MSNINERLNHLIKIKVVGHRRFKELEDLTGISSESWRAFECGKQKPSAAMLVAVSNIWPNYAHWLMTGAGVAEAALKPTLDNGIDARVCLLIEDKYHKKNQTSILEFETGISSESWRKVLSKKQNPTLQMVQVLAKLWTDYAYWLVTGDTEPEYGNYAPKNASPLAFTPCGIPMPARTKERAYRQALLQKLEAVPAASFGELGEAIFKVREEPSSTMPYFSLERILHSLGERFTPRLALMENDEELIELRRLSMAEAEASLKACKEAREKYWTTRTGSSMVEGIKSFMKLLSQKQ